MDLSLEEILRTQQKERWSSKRRFGRIAVVAVTATTIACSVPSVSLAQEVRIETEFSNAYFSLEAEKPLISISEMILEMEEKKAREAEERIQAKFLAMTKRKASIEARERIKVKEAAEVEAQKAREEREEAERAKVKAKQEAQRQLFAPVAHEVTILSLMMDAEAELTEADMIYVGSVILNRFRTTYSDFREITSIAGVLYQVIDGDRQYDSHTIQYVESGRQPSSEALRIAQGLLDGTIECLPEHILYQTTQKMPWMYGRIGDANLPGAAQYYGYPLDFEEKCL